jgi:copper transport protein
LIRGIRSACGRLASAGRPPAVLALALLALAPASAGAHAVLTHSTPHRGSTVNAPPRQVVFDFNEPVEASFGSVRVFDSDGRRVDQGEVAYPYGHQRSVGVGLRPGLGRGLYTATYRVVSADGHPVSGGFSFGVGVAGIANGGNAPSVADLLEDTDAGPGVEIPYGVVRGLHYAALLLMVGAIGFWGLVWRGLSAERWPGGLLLGAATLGLVSAAAGVSLQGALGAGVGLGHGFDSTVLHASLDTRTGLAWAVRAGAWLVLIAALFSTRAPGGRRALLASVPVLVLVLSMPYGGHARTQSPAWVLMPADAVHVTAAGAWLGGLVLLLAAFWPRGGEAARGAAEATRRFSRMALPAVALLLGAGLVQAWFFLGSPGELFDGSAYSLSLLAKMALLAEIVALASGNRRRTAGLAGDGAVPGALRRAMRFEVGLAVLVLAATAVLVREQPPESLASGPATRELDLGPMRLEMVVEPPKVGPNDFHLYFFDRRSGAQVDRVKELTVRVEQHDKGVGPLTLRVPRKGPAHYELLDQALGVPGTWDVTVDARVSEFDSYTAHTRIHVSKP